jgi:zinc protease
VIRPSLLALLALGAALAGCAARSEVNASHAASAASRLALPPTASFQFADGLVADVASLHELPILTAYVVVAGGARRDPDGKAGLASFTAGLLDEGAGGMSRTQFLQALDRIGARFVARGGPDDVTLTLSFLSRDLDAALGLLFAAAFAPEFPDDAVEKARVRTLGQLVAARDDEEALARQVLYARLFAGHAYGRPVAGEEKSVSTFTRDDVVAFHQANFAPARLRVILSGDVEPEAAVAAIARAAIGRGVELGEAAPHSEPPFAAGGEAGEPQPARTFVLVHKPEVSQPQVLFGCRAPAATHQDAIALRAANVLFGGGFTSRLVDRLRVDLGLTYDVNSSIDLLAEGSVFCVQSFTKSETVAPLLSEAFGELDRLKRGDLDEEALARAKSTLTTGVVEELETTDGVADLLRTSLLLKTGRDAVTRFGRELDSLELKQVQQAVARHLPDSRHVLCVVVGDREELEPQLSPLGPVEVVDYKTLTPLDPITPAHARASGNGLDGGGRP